MLQQTGVKTVGPYFEKFLARWPDVAALGARRRSTTCCGCGPGSAIIRARAICTPARWRCCAIMAGCFRDTEEGLRALPGIGPYTAAAIAAIAFDRRTMPVDGNIERVVSRLFAVEEPLPQAKPLIQQLATTLARRASRWRRESRAGDSAQALMDLGSSICTPKKPACALCPLNEDCAARARGDQETFPRKAAKKTGALRRGAAFVVTRGDELLVRTPPGKGPARRHDRGADLGLARRAGRQGGAEAGAGAEGRRALASQGRRRHAMSSRIFRWNSWSIPPGAPRARRAPEGMRWVPIATLQDEALPNVMRKVIAHGLGL